MHIFARLCVSHWSWDDLLCLQIASDAIRTLMVSEVALHRYTLHRLQCVQDFQGLHVHDRLQASSSHLWPSSSYSMPSSCTRNAPTRYCDGRRCATIPNHLSSWSSVEQTHFWLTSRYISTTVTACHFMELSNSVACLRYIFLIMW